MSDTEAIIWLQALMDHICRRICSIFKVQETVIACLTDANLNEMYIRTKYRFEGSSGHPMYKQWTCNGVEDSDSFILCTVPFRDVVERTIVEIFEM